MRLSKLDAKLSTAGSFENYPLFVVVRVTVAPTVLLSCFYRGASRRHDDIAFAKYLTQL